MENTMQTKQTEIFNLEDYSKHLHEQVNGVFLQHKNGEPVLRKPKLFNMDKFRKLSAENLYEIRKKTIMPHKQSLIKQSYDLAGEDKKDLEFKIILYEEMRYNLELLTLSKEQSK